MCEKRLEGEVHFKPIKFPLAYLVLVMSRCACAWLTADIKTVYCGSVYLTD